MADQKYSLHQLEQAYVMGILNRPDITIDKMVEMDMPKNWIKVREFITNEKYVRPQLTGDPQIHDDMRGVAFGLGAAQQYKLEAEVVMWALYAMKRNPQLSLTEAICEGVDEWIK